MKKWTDLNDYTMYSLLKKPSAWVPVALSLGVLAAMLFCIAVFGVPAHEKDEGVGAHLFQMWLVVEAVMIAFFAIKWLPQKPKQAISILAIQTIAVLAACFPVFYFRL